MYLLVILYIINNNTNNNIINNNKDNKIPTLCTPIGHNTFYYRNYVDCQVEGVCFDIVAVYTVTMLNRSGWRL